MYSLLLACACALLSRAALAATVVGPSYLCLDLANHTDLCLGISPGAATPVWDPNNIYYAQASWHGARVALTTRARTCR